MSEFGANRIIIGMFIGVWDPRKILHHGNNLGLINIFCYVEHKKFIYFLVLFLTISVASCEKKAVPTVETSVISNITFNSCTIGGKVTYDGNTEVIDRGVCWSKDHLPTITEGRTHDGSGLGLFLSTITELEHNTNYFVRAYAANSEGTGYGKEESFITLKNKWTSYSRSDSIGFNDIYEIAIDAQDNKWFRTNGGVLKFDGFTWSNYTKLDGLIENHVHSIAIDAYGNKWFGTSGGVSKFDGTNWTTYTIQVAFHLI